MGALVRRLSARNGPIGPVVTLSLAPDVAAGSGRTGALRAHLGARADAGFLADCRPGWSGFLQGAFGARHW